MMKPAFISELKRIVSVRGVYASQQCFHKAHQDSAPE